MNILRVIKNWWNPPELRYPIPFALVVYTPTAQMENIKDEQNKIVIKHFVNRYGNLEKRKFKYSEALIKILEKEKIPVYDKTKQEQRFPVFAKSMPGEVSYVTK